MDTKSTMRTATVAPAFTWRNGKHCPVVHAPWAGGKDGRYLALVESPPLLELGRKVKVHQRADGQWTLAERLPDADSWLERYRARIAREMQD